MVRHQHTSVDMSPAQSWWGVIYKTWHWNRMGVLTHPVNTHYRWQESHASLWLLRTQLGFPSCGRHKKHSEHTGRELGLSSGHMATAHSVDVIYAATALYQPSNNSSQVFSSCSGWAASTQLLKDVRRFPFLLNKPNSLLIHICRLPYS